MTVLKDRNDLLSKIDKEMSELESLERGKEADIKRKIERRGEDERNIFARTRIAIDIVADKMREASHHLGGVEQGFCIVEEKIKEMQSKLHELEDSFAKNREELHQLSLRLESRKPCRCDIIHK